MTSSETTALDQAEIERYLEDTVNNLIFDEDTFANYDPKWNEKVKRVCVICSPPRSCSSFLQEQLRSCSDFATLTGEEGIHMGLTKNRIPFVDNSFVPSCKNQDLLLKLYFSELGYTDGDNSDEDNFKKLISDWKLRLSALYPGLDKEIYAAIPLLVENCYRGEVDISSAHRVFLRSVLGKLQASCFAVNANIISNPHLQVTYIPEPRPYGAPSLKKQITVNDLETKYLIFKTVYANSTMGIHSQLFPNAEIKYIHLTRNFAANINSIMDAWLSPTFQLINVTKTFGVLLDIGGYSDVVEGGRNWWSLPTPPNWRDLIDMPLEKVGLEQWYQIHDDILSKLESANSIQVKAENVVTDSAKEMERIADFLGVPEIELRPNRLCYATSLPKNRKWQSRSDVILPLASDKKTIEMMGRLGYTMDSDSWL